MVQVQAVNPSWFALGVLAIAGLLALVGLALLIWMLVQPKTRPWAIAVLVAGAVFLFLFLMLLIPTAHYRYAGAGDVITMPIQQNPIITLNTDAIKVGMGNKTVGVSPKVIKAATEEKLFTVNSLGAYVTIGGAGKNTTSRTRQTTTYFPLSSQLVRNVLLPIPPVASIDALQKKIAALETALKDIKRSLANATGEGLPESMAKELDAPPLNTADFAAVAAVATAPERLELDLAAAEAESPDNISPADKAPPINDDSISQLIKKYEQILQKNPDSPDVYTLLGRALIEDGRPREAIEYLKRAVVLTPDFHKAYNNLGKAYLQTGRAKEAVDYLQEAVRLWPPYYEAHYNLGNALLQLGQRKEAIEQYELALRYSKDNYPQASDKLNALVKFGSAEGKTKVLTGAKPDWVGKPPRRVGDSYAMSLATGPYTTRLECDAKVPEVLQAALDQFVEAYLGRPAVGWVQLKPEQLRQLVAEEWEEHLQSSVGPMIQVHLLVNFDQKVKNIINEAMSLNEFTERAAVVGVGLIGLWLFLGWIWAYLKLDLATKGAYRNRLRFAFGSVILVVIFLIWVANFT